MTSDISGDKRVYLKYTFTKRYQDILEKVHKHIYKKSTLLEARILVTFLRFPGKLYSCYFLVIFQLV